MNRNEAITQYVKTACEIALDPTHGYDQTHREGPDFDCSALIIEALKAAGIDLKKYGGTYTGNMYSALKKAGFEDVKGATPESGDIFLTPKSHVMMYVGDKTIVHAVGNEKGTATGGETGDQTGREIRLEVTNDYDYKYQMRLAGGVIVKQKKVANCYYVNVRKGASGTSAVVCVVAKGMTVNVTGPAVGAWTPVEINGKTGYIKSDYLEG